MRRAAFALALSFPTGYAVGIILHRLNLRRATPRVAH